MNLFLFLAFFNLHDHHVSVCDIIYNKNNGSLEIIQSVIVDDLEKVLKKPSQRKNLDLLHPAQVEANEELIKNYFEKHLQLFQNGEMLAQTWIGYEIIENQVRAYIEIENIAGTENISLVDNILVADFRKQQNMVHWKFGDKLQTTVLSRTNSVAELKQ